MALFKVARNKRKNVNFSQELRVIPEILGISRNP